MTDRDALLTEIASRIEAGGLRGFSCFRTADGWRVTPRSQVGWQGYSDASTLAAALERAFCPPAAEPIDYNRTVVICDDDDDGMHLV